MDRRQMMTGAAIAAVGATAKLGAQQTGAGLMHRFLELKTYRLHTSDENQGRRVADYLEHGVFPALQRAGARPVAALGNLIGPDGPYIMSITQFTSLAAMDQALTKLDQDAELERTSQLLSAGLTPGMTAPFVRVESSLIRCFNAFPEAILAPPAGEKRTGRVFELRIYESQTPAALRLKVEMFEGGEIGVFQRLGMRPVFFGETVVGPRMPCIAYMLSFDSLAERERLWSAFGSDPEWKKISAPPQLKDAQIVGNIGNVMLRALPFSPLK